MIAMERETCTLTIKSNEKIGHLYFDHGFLIDAEYDNNQGEETAYEILAWEDVEIEIEKKCKKKVVTDRKNAEPLIDRSIPEKG